MTLRPAEAGDIRAIRAVAERAYVKYVPRIGRVPAPMAADFKVHVRRGDTTVAMLDNAVAGYLIAYPRADDYFVENVAVDPAAAGQGIGKALMMEAERQARAVGRNRVVLYTNVRMWENFPFYGTLGYRTTGVVKEAGFRRIYFEKELE